MTELQNTSILTGIKPTGTPHIGNYFGAIEPALRRASQYSQAYFFIADYHALNSVQDAEELKALTYSVAAMWLAAGLDPSRMHFYRQSDVPEVFEVETMLNMVTPKGWMNKMHAYKASVDRNRAAGKPDDNEVNMGLYTYPILMAGDILLFNATHVPVGHDQIQHVEIARDIAGRFNKSFNAEGFVLPEHVVADEIAEIPGLDGRKMSKSYGNTIPLFGELNPQVSSEKQMHKAIMKIVTNSQLPSEPKDPDDSAIFEIYKAFAAPTEIADMRAQFAAGIGWGDAKQALFDKINNEVAPFRARYEELMANPKELEEILQMGAEKARRHSRKQLDKTRRAIGIRPLAKLK